MMNLWRRLTNRDEGIILYNNEPLRITFFILWFDGWIGFFYDDDDAILYVNLLPFLVLKFQQVVQDQRNKMNVNYFYFLSDTKNIALLVFILGYYAGTKYKRFFPLAILIAVLILSYQYFDSTGQLLTWKIKYGIETGYIP